MGQNLKPVQHPFVPAAPNSTRCRDCMFHRKAHPSEVVAQWVCRKCGYDMDENLSVCPRCDYTVFTIKKDI